MKFSRRGSIKAAVASVVAFFVSPIKGSKGTTEAIGPFKEYRISPPYTKEQQAKLINQNRCPCCGEESWRIRHPCTIEAVSTTLADWIPITFSLPDDDAGYVLVACSGLPGVREAEYDKRDGLWVNRSRIVVHTVMHWAQLPSPPKA